jgi:hypothetical protein
MGCLISWYFAAGLLFSLTPGWTERPEWLNWLLLLAYSLVPIAISTVGAAGAVQLALRDKRRGSVECALIALVTPPLTLFALHLTFMELFA